jgi:hypothetical protein
MWTCPHCRSRWNENKQRCCGRKRPWRKPSHKQVLKELPYEAWVEMFGETCGICGVGPSETRRLDRDHEHRGEGRPRGLLCHLCNRRLDTRATPEWLRAAADYLERACANEGEGLSLVEYPMERQ